MNLVTTLRCSCMRNYKGISTTTVALNQLTLLDILEIEVIILPDRM